MLVRAFAWSGMKADAARLLPVVEDIAASGVVLLYDGTLVRLPCGVAAACAGHWERAEAHYAAALEQAEGMSHQAACAETRFWWAAMLRDRARAGDEDRARVLMTHAANELERLEMPLYACRAREWLSRPC